MAKYIVASTKEWNKEQFLAFSKKVAGEWRFVGTREELDRALLQTKPRFIFFLHWNWRVPNAIVLEHESICFHMTDVPFGRGGSPLQNLIAQGFVETKVSALRMVEEFDAGPVYIKRTVSLAGRAEEIYLRVGDICFDLIAEIIKEECEPLPQEGDVVTFTRRCPLDSVLPKTGDLSSLYDHIRMLDAPSYPRAFLQFGEFTLEFHHASLQEDTLEASVCIRKHEPEHERDDQDQ